MNEKGRSLPQSPISGEGLPLIFLTRGRGGDLVQGYRRMKKKTFSTATDTIQKEQ